MQRVILSTVLIINLCAAPTYTDNPPVSPVTVYVNSYPANITNNNSGSNVAAATQEQDVNLDVKHNVQHQVDVKHFVQHQVDVTYKVKFEFPNLFNNNLGSYITSPLHSLQTTLHNNKWTIAATALIAGYAWTLYQVKQTEKLLQQHNAWCNWKSAVPLAHLILNSAQDLLRELNIDIHKKYILIARDIATVSKTNNNFETLFIKDIQQELYLLNQYDRWYHLAHKLWCSKLFYFQYDATIIEEKKARLSFLLDLFMSKYAQQ